MPRGLLNIIGISAYYHDSACCLLQDGALLAAAQEERFSRKKHDASLPVRSFQYCLREAGLTITDVDCIAYYEQPQIKLERQIWSSPELSTGKAIHLWRSSTRPEREIRELLGYTGPICYASHHESHAASAFYFSGFEDAAILTVDGVGEWATTTYGRAKGSQLELIDEVHFPHSLGLLYSTLTSFLGFGVNDGEYKVMGLAPYGNPAYVEHIWRLIELLHEGQYRLSVDYFNFNSSEQMFSDSLPVLFGHSPREAGAEITQFHIDVARSVQQVLEDVLVAKARYLRSQVDSDNLCMAGGVALNCVANSKLRRDGSFRKVFIQPAAGDAGSALGAAAISHLQLSGQRVPVKSLEHVFLGPSFASEEIYRLLETCPFQVEDCRGQEPRLLKAAVDRLLAGQVVGWFHGRMEFGPRALGHRSILADPRCPRMRDHINALVKKRESFRPFAPAIIVEDAGTHFDLSGSSPFMLETCQVTSAVAMPAITHVDGSARVQTVSETATPRFYRLLQTFKTYTGCPVLLNTSFNMKDEPIVCTPTEALVCFLRSGIDTLVLEDFLVDRASLGCEWEPFLQSLIPTRDGISHKVYTLV